MSLQTFEEKVDAAVHAAMNALGISAERYPGTADAMNDAIYLIARNVVTDDSEEG
ncbi:hypothetical protein RCMENCHIE_107 [Rhodobacter phage RcMenchie]|nr:hypothetical protein RCMENCHIE_107 [Rhodobacter phage RcMenchie]